MAANLIYILFFWLNRDVWHTTAILLKLSPLLDLLFEHFDHHVLHLLGLIEFLSASLVLLKFDIGRLKWGGAKCRSEARRLVIRCISIERAFCYTAEPGRIIHG